MKRFLVGTAINSLGLYLVTILIPAIKIAPWGGDSAWNLLASYLFVGMIFGLVTAIVAPVVKVLAFPLYILTFGLISVVINGAMLLLVAWLSSNFEAGIFSIDGATLSNVESAAFGWAILGSVVISVSTFVARAAFKALRIL
jgi:putative membrane protein